MMEEESSVDPKAHAEPNTYGETLLYDFAKFLTTLSILTLGGVLTISGAADPADVKPGNVIMAVIAITCAATLAAITAHSIAHARYTGEPMPGKLHRFLLVGVGLLGMGLGAFLFMWADSLT